MSDRIHVLAQQLFGKSSVEECGLKEIQDLADRYPYFAPAQFLLLEKLKQENAEGYHPQLQKAVLYYHNPLEFEYFISSERFYTEEAVPFSMLPEPKEATDTQTDVSTVELPVSKLNVSDADGDEEINVLAHPSFNIDLPHEEAIEEETANYHLPPADKKPNPELEIRNPELEIRNAEPETRNAESLAFEPYHTVDYFASQGIKLSQEEVPKDKFGKQLKSFTEWLKTMKRIPPSEIPKATTDVSTEIKVQHLAEDSVHDAEVVTEAMAEVWMKQGNRQKAIETYNKLSLQNPSKRAYFAALIEDLKRS